MPLSNDDVNAVLLRADQIQRAEVRGANEAEIQRFIERAEASGYSRAAVLQALRERFGLTTAPVAVGDRVFALSSDGKFHIASVVSLAPGEARVRYLRGSERTVASDEVRPFALAPGERIGVNWPMWGPWSCELVSYDEANGTVTLSDRWGSEKMFPIAEIWIEPPSASGGFGSFVLWTSLLGAGAAIGGVLATIISRIIP
jgi:hypothetical protein